MSKGAHADESAGQQHRLLCFADTDSYIKWAANLLTAVPGDYAVRFVLVASAQLPSHRQLVEALSGTPYAHAKLDVLNHHQMRELVHEWRPDMVFAAARGYIVSAYLDELFGSVKNRPVIVSGLPGISVPALANGVRSRRGADVFILHSHEEVKAYQALATRLQIPVQFGLASLPYLNTQNIDGDSTRERDEVVFATQAKVPKTRWERMKIVAALADTARAHPEWRVVIKVRALAGEAQTHAEAYAYQDLLAEYAEASGDCPANLVVAGGPMLAHLARAVGLVTISSTAVVEAVAQSVPVITLDDFGVSRGLINVVFADSGMMAPAAALVAGWFQTPKATWLHNNYFHPESDNNWWQLALAAQRHRTTFGLGKLRRARPGLLPKLRMAFYKHQAFAPEPLTWKYRATDAFWSAVLRVQQALKDRRNHHRGM